MCFRSLPLSLLSSSFEKYARYLYPCFIRMINQTKWALITINSEIRAMCHASLIPLSKLRKPAGEL